MDFIYRCATYPLWPFETKCKTSAALQNHNNYKWGVESDTEAVAQSRIYNIWGRCESDLFYILIILASSARKFIGRRAGNLITSAIFSMIQRDLVMSMYNRRISGHWTNAFRFAMATRYDRLALYFSIMRFQRTSA